ncbi:MmcQ/YjbR family DNA-binding protein [Subtercola sp. YIM 133946]|uniref:MmcQ/YjbR family DNA-binding protein n=1 Tax=Subtercola sp. YIM 133946 TaxID=3118909 RepID=UPI002F950303
MAFSSEHPPQFAADDPLIARLREIALALPDASELETWGRPNFRVNQRIFLIAGLGNGARASVWFKPDADERPALLQQPGFFTPRYFGSKGWLALDLADDPAAVDWTLVAELADTSYRLIALKRQVAVLDARASARPDER